MIKILNYIKNKINKMKSNKNESVYENIKII